MICIAASKSLLVTVHGGLAHDGVSAVAPVCPSTAPAGQSGRDGETALNQTEKHQSATRYDVTTHAEQRGGQHGVSETYVHGPVDGYPLSCS